MPTRDRKAKGSDPAPFDYPFDHIRPAWMDLEGMQESAQRRELLQLQLEKERDEAEARNVNPKAQGAAQRARKIDQLVIALLAVDAGWINEGTAAGWAVRRGAAAVADSVPCPRSDSRVAPPADAGAAAVQPGAGGGAGAGAAADARLAPGGATLPRLPGGHVRGAHGSQSAGHGSLALHPEPDSRRNHRALRSPERRLRGARSGRRAPAGRAAAGQPPVRLARRQRDSAELRQAHRRQPQ